MTTLSTHLRPLAILAAAITLTACEAGMEAAAPAPEPYIAADAEPAFEAPAIEHVRPAPSTRGARAGVLTAGDIDDTLNLASFGRYTAEAARRLSLPRARLGQPIQLALRNWRDQPLPGQYITLTRPGAEQPFYAGYSGVDGNVTVFPNVYGQKDLRKVQLRVFDDGGSTRTQMIDVTGARTRVAAYGATEANPDFLDLVFVVDTTGSMADELAWLTKEIARISTAAKRSAPGVNIRYGLVVYRDHGDAYVVRRFDFTNRLSVMQRRLRDQSAGGGGDYPEAAADALQAAVSMNWRAGRGERLLFHIADAPPHDKDASAYLNAARVAAQKNVQIFGLGASGVAPESEFLMRQASAMTQGRYLFLTDDSGVGYGHAEPTIACYRVTKLTDLMIRVLRSELTGRRIEASDRSVIRQVGAYRNGICLQ